MTLQQLRYFRILARYESIAEAARVIHISQPALSMSMKKLESELQYPLFDRTGNSIRLNENGRQFAESVNYIFALLESCKQRTSLPGRERQELWLGMLSTSTGIINLCDLYMQKHRNVIIRFLSRRFLDMTPEMERVDLLFSSQDLWREGFSSVMLFEFRNYAIVPKNYLLSPPKEIDLADLANIPFVLCCPPDIAQPRILKMFLDRGCTPNIQFIADSRIDVMSVMKTGRYLTICPTHDVTTYLRMSPNLIAIPVKADNLDRNQSGHVYVSWKDGKLNPQARDLLEFMIKGFKNMPSDVDLF